MWCVTWQRFINMWWAEATAQRWQKESVYTEVEFPVREDTNNSNTKLCSPASPVTWSEASRTASNACVCFLRSIRELLRICAEKEKISFTLKVWFSVTVGVRALKKRIHLGENEPTLGEQWSNRVLHILSLTDLFSWSHNQFGSLTSETWDYCFVQLWNVSVGKCVFSGQNKWMYLRSFSDFNVGDL